MMGLPIRKKSSAFIRIVCCLVAGVLLIACATTESQVEELTVPSPAERVTVRWLVVGEGTEPWMQSAGHEFVARFNKSQDRIKLELRLGMGGGGLSNLIETGDAPDLVGPLSPNFSSRFIEIWSDIEALLVDHDTLDAFDSTTLEAWRREGKLIGAPFGYWPAVLYYNKDIFDRAGLAYPPHRYGENYSGGGAWTLEKVAEIGPSLTLDSAGRDARTPGFDLNQAVQWGFLIEGNIRAASAIFGTSSILNPSGNVQLPQSWRDAVSWMHDAIWESMFFPNEAGFERMNGDPFGKGAAAMYYAPSYFMCCETRFNWDIAAVPSWAGKVTSRREQSGFGIPQASQHKEEALQVIMAMASDPSLIAAYRIVPAWKDMRKDLKNNLSARQPQVDWQVLVDSINYPDDPPYSQFLPGASGVFGRFNDFADGLLTNPDFNVETELDALEADLQALIEQ